MLPFDHIAAGGSGGFRALGCRGSGGGVHCIGVVLCGIEIANVAVCCERGIGGEAGGALFVWLEDRIDSVLVMEYGNSAWES